jgi:hypothetical protein
MNPLVQWDSPREIENADGSKVRASTLAKLSSDLLATREPASPAPGQPSYLTLSINPNGPIATQLAAIATGYVVSVGVTAPIVNTGTASGPIIGISPASGSTAGSMSIAHYTLVDGATVSATPNRLVQRDASDASIVGGHFKTSAVNKATFGTVRCAYGEVAVAFRNVANTGNFMGLSHQVDDKVQVGDNSTCMGVVASTDAGGSFDVQIASTGSSFKVDGASVTIPETSNLNVGAQTAISGSGGFAMRFGENVADITIGDGTVNETIKLESTNADGIHLKVNGADVLYVENGVVHITSIASINGSGATGATVLQVNYTPSSGTRTVVLSGSFLETTDATTTNLATFAIPDGATVTIKANIIARRSNGDSASYGRKLTVKRVSGGVATVVGSERQLWADDEDDPAFAFALDVDGGNNSRARATGVGTTRWFGTIEVMTLIP